MSDSNSGQCARCNSVNPYSAAACLSCGSRLPWADAVDAAKRSAAAQAATDQAKRLEVAQAEAKAAKEIAKTTPITQRQSSPITAVLVWIMATGLVGYLAWGFFESNRFLNEDTVRDQTDERRSSTSGGNSSLTLSMYNQLHDGMSQSDVIAILGPPASTSTLDFGGVTTLGCNWAAPGVMISVSFQGGVLTAKSQSGL